MAGKRIVIGGLAVNYTCENSYFKTDISSPVNSIYPGSVSVNPIYVDSDTGDILLLENVEHKSNGSKCFWFMWYYANGIPKMPMSGIIGSDDILEVIRNISQIKFS